MRVLADGQTHTHTHRQTQTDFIICPMLYAIAMGQIITYTPYRHEQAGVCQVIKTTVEIEWPENAC